MRIDPIALWVSPVSNLAGVGRHIVDVARVGVPGWRIVYTAPEGPLLDELRALGRPTLVWPVDSASPTESVASLRHTLKTLRPAIAHSHLAKADLLLAAAAARLPIPLVTTEHGISSDRYLYHSNRLKAATMETVHRARLTRFAHAIAVSRATAAAMKQRWHTKVPLSVILNGVDRPSPTPAPAAGLRILSLTRLAPEKNLDLTLRVAARVIDEHPEARLMLAGDGSDEARLRSLAASLGVADKVEFPGFVKAESVLASHDVLLQPSRSENLSYSILDAVAAGLGVVASPVGGNPEILPPHCLVGVDDKAGLARAVVEQGLELGRRPSLPDSVPTVAEMTDAIAQIYATIHTPTEIDTRRWR